MKFEHKMSTSERNRDLIDCYLSGQISEQSWQQHLNEEPGLAHAWAARPRRCNPRVGDDRIVGFHPALCAPYGCHEALRADAAVNQELRQIAAAAAGSDPMPPLGDSRRRLSPHFPTIAEGKVIRQRKHEAIAARTLLGFTAAFALSSPFVAHPSHVAVAAVVCFIGFIITCIVAGSRHDQGGAYGTGSNVP
jgi:hypothetical protein